MIHQLPQRPHIFTCISTEFGEKFENPLGVCVCEDVQAPRLCQHFDAPNSSLSLSLTHTYIYVYIYINIF